MDEKFYEYYCVINWVSSIEVTTLKKAIKLTSGTMVSLDTCYIKKVPSRYIQLQTSSNFSNILIPDTVMQELKEHLTQEENYKYEIIKKIINNGTYKEPKNHCADRSVVDAISPVGFVFSGDYGVIAYAISINTCSVYVVDKKELEVCNGINNLEKMYRKNVGKKLKNIEII